jgi:hypothetical protein
MHSGAAHSTVDQLKAVLTVHTFELHVEEGSVPTHTCSHQSGLVTPHH